MRANNILPRFCHASSSRLPQTAVHLPTLRHLSVLPPRVTEPLAPFFTPPFRPPIGFTSHAYPALNGKGKCKAPGPQRDEEEVDDREWEIRSARAMLHLRNTVPHFFDYEHSSSALFPSDIYSQNVYLKLSHPLPLKISSLSAYSLAFAIARNGMQALHTDLRTNLERMTFSLAPREAISSDRQSALLLRRKPIPAHRQKQIRVQVAVHGTVRLPPHHEAVWQTSSLYTLSPASGLIVSHEVESIRPLPGEGVAEWLKTRVLGWTGNGLKHEEHIPCPRTVPVPSESELAAYLRKMKRGDGQ